MSSSKGNQHQASVLQAPIKRSLQPLLLPDDHKAHTRVNLPKLLLRSLSHQKLSKLLLRSNNTMLSHPRPKILRLPLLYSRNPLPNLNLSSPRSSRLNQVQAATLLTKRTQPKLNPSSLSLYQLRCHRVHLLNHPNPASLSMATLTLQPHRIISHLNHLLHRRAPSLKPSRCRLRLHRPQL